MTAHRLTTRPSPDPIVMAGDPFWLSAGPRTLVVCSAQGKTPRGSDPWLVALREAIVNIRDRGGVLLGSSGPLFWDLSVTLAADLKVPVILILPNTGTPLPPRLSEVATRYGLHPDRLLIVQTAQGAAGKAGWRQRDALVWSLAERLLPIAVRAGGLQAARLAAADRILIDEQFATPCEAGPWVPPIEQPPVMPDEDQAHAWLVHWTRRRYTPWPDEHLGDLCRAVLASRDRWCRDAPATLEQIVRTGMLRASTFRSSGGVPVVSFTGATPASMRANFRWCARKVAPMWEPYGIAMRREVLEAMGARPVLYGRGSADVPAWQCHGGGSYAGEVEWRIRGDVTLAGFPAGTWRTVTPSTWPFWRQESGNYGR